MVETGRRWWRGYTASVLLVAGGFILLVATLVQSFLLFHSLVELLSILVAFAVFIVTWNARDDIDHSFIVVLGISYLFVGALDLLHTLAYEGMGVFPAATANLPTQLWVFSRYLQAVSLLLGAGLGVLAVTRGREYDWDYRRIVLLCTGYLAVVGAGLAAIFVFDVFPTAYVPGAGLTPFKIYSEYVIIGLLAGALYLLYRQRASFDDRVFQLLAASVVFTMASEFMFTLYVDVYGLSNVVGHFLKIGSFHLVYLAVVKTGIREPQRTLYRKLSEREAHARTFKQAADYSGHPVLITDCDGTITYVNEAWERMTGYSVAEVEGENPNLLKSGVHDDAFYADLWETILDGNVWEGEFVNVRKNGERFIVHQTISPIVAESGEIQGFVSINDDITEQKAYEHQLETDLHESIRQLRVLARVLRHNIRNTMNLVVGNSARIKEADPGESVVEMADQVERAGNRLLELAEKQRELVDVLSDPTSFTSIDLTVLLDEIIARLDARYPNADLSLDAPEHLEIETLRELEIAVEEVVENAIIHNDQNVPRVAVKVLQAERSVGIRIEDNGPGIPSVERDVITGEAEIGNLIHSSGMGLWLVNQIVSNIGGGIQFEEAAERGSVVTLHVPRMRPESRRGLEKVPTHVTDWPGQ